jgi:tagatose 6-phosphate kinase
MRAPDGETDVRLLRVPVPQHSLRPPQSGAGFAVILAVCLNPALDITYRTDALRHGASHRVELAGERAGGKGINVARVLHQFGLPTLVTGLLGGGRGSVLEADLDTAGVPHAFSPIAGPSRRSITVVDGEDATVLNEPGPVVSADEWQRFLDAYRELVGGAQAVTLSGSTPPGLECSAYATLVALADAASVPVVLDAAGPAMTLALAHRPAVVAPNRAEVVETLERAFDGTAELAVAAAELRDRGAGSAVISNGADGLVCSTPKQCWLARPHRRVDGNPTGAGDALTAALAAGLARNDGWPEMLRAGVGWAAGAVAAHIAGEVDEHVAAEAADEMILEELR